MYVTSSRDIRQSRKHKAKKTTELRLHCQEYWEPLWTEMCGKSKRQYFRMVKLLLWWLNDYASLLVLKTVAMWLIEMEPVLQ